MIAGKEINSDGDHIINRKPQVESLEAFYLKMVL
ncbi:hypothetical protein HDF23_003260 [Mucilaginibacter lappiensis]|uniref:Uncharacterized protein n=1 Tax=Mucilaginibacter lappiensis TaxID=354630 RepID=A0ABR6PL60_9SPHI|nr:hypothetical protein [Mucilaginibacter lappiensis]